ncbi:MAG TPA: hypothetical protein VEX64_02070 [Pyrinomonadaceae bacterium]|jgi:hypothetical protein|nr:hypothetical protein [Pyrinomonadaceae bacterium]
MSVIKEPSQKRQTTNGRTIRVGKWIESLNTSDVNQLWAELHRVVCHHPLVRASRSAGLLVEEGSRQPYTDLTQELFVALLSKERFQHYITTGMTNAEVEAEISQIELTNLLTAELRKRYPESYRLARRISTLVQSSPKFRRFDALRSGEQSIRRLADRIYGLSVWFDDKPRRNAPELQERVAQVPVHKRDTRNVGCTGDAQVVITNPDLELLIVRVFEALDAPTDIRSIRSLVMSRLPVMDIFLVPIGGSGSDDSDEDRVEFELTDGCDTPEQGLLRGEAEDVAAGSVDRFLDGLSEAVRGKMKQYNRILGVLWHCYLSTEGGTQLEVAATLGVSDSLVSDYRRRIEAELQALAFTELEEARRFEQALKLRVSEMIEDGEEILVRN